MFKIYIATPQAVSTVHYRTSIIGAMQTATDIMTMMKMNSIVGSVHIVNQKTNRSIIIPSDGNV